MIVELLDTTSTEIQKRLIKVREEGGAVALGRVLTFLIHTSGSREEKVIEAANEASREHPMRIVVISESDEARVQLRDWTQKSVWAATRARAKS